MRNLKAVFILLFSLFLYPAAHGVESCTIELLHSFEKGVEVSPTSRDLADEFLKNFTYEKNRFLTHADNLTQSALEELPKYNNASWRGEYIDSTLFFNSYVKNSVIVESGYTTASLSTLVAEKGFAAPSGQVRVLFKIIPTNSRALWRSQLKNRSTKNDVLFFPSSFKVVENNLIGNLYEVTLQQL